MPKTNRESRRADLYTGSVDRVTIDSHQLPVGEWEFDNPNNTDPHMRPMSRKLESDYFYFSEIEGEKEFRVRVAGGVLYTEKWDGSIWDSIGLLIAPEVYDLTSSNTLLTLSIPDGSYKEKSAYWENGNGTYKIQFSVPDSLGVYTTSVYEGEGEGHITWETVKLSDGSNAWKVVDYEDSGSNSNGNWTKELNGELRQWGTDATSISISANSIAGITITLPLAMRDTTYSYNVIGRPNSSSDFIGLIYHERTSTSTTITSFAIVYKNGATAQNVVEHIWTAIGTWK